MLQIEAGMAGGKCELSSGTRGSGDPLQVSEGGHVQRTCREASLCQANKKIKFGFIEVMSFHTVLSFPSSIVLHFQAHWSRICCLHFSGAFVIFPEHNLKLTEVHSKILL